MTRWILLLALATWAQTAPPPVDAVSGATRRYLPMEVESHLMHAELSLPCTACHHEAEASVARCVTCHTGDAERRGMHGKCVPCHQQERAKKADSPAPVACLECHRERGGPLP